MAESAPHFNLFKIINRISAINQYVFWLIFILSISPFLIHNYCVKCKLDDLLNVLNIVGIAVYFALELLNDFILIPLSDSKRRDDFIDNSFGSNHSPINSVGYYDNDEVNKGLYKTAVNLFENCFFTFSLVKMTTARKIVFPIIILMSMLVLSYFGFKVIPFGLTLLQALFSVNIIGLVVKQFILLNRLQTIHDSWIALFQNEDFKTDEMKYQTFVYKYWLQYEVLHGKIHPGIPEKIFHKYNSKLTEEWKKIKEKFNIN